MDQIDTIEKLETKLKYCVNDEDQICSLLLKKKKQKPFVQKLLRAKLQICVALVLFFFILLLLKVKKYCPFIY